MIAKTRFCPETGNIYALREDGEDDITDTVLDAVTQALHKEGPSTVELSTSDGWTFRWTMTTDRDADGKARITCERLRKQ